MDLAQEAPAFLELEVKDGVGGFEERFVVGQDVLHNVFRFHHALPPVLHVLLHHVKVQSGWLAHEQVDFVQAGFEFVDFGLEFFLLVA